MKCNIFKDYHEIYLQCDVLLLADIFENFRETCHTNYGVDPANYVSAPGLAWDAMLLNTKVELDLITGLELMDVIERQSDVAYAL